MHSRPDYLVLQRPCARRADLSDLLVLVLTSKKYIFQRNKLFVFPNRCVLQLQHRVMMRSSCVT